MCRLFFSFCNKSVKPLLKEFLAQSHHKTKNTPTVDNHRDDKEHTDGFGIAWKPVGGKNWDVYKQSKLYTKDPHLDAVLDAVNTAGSKVKGIKGIFGERTPDNLVIAHIRRKTYGNISTTNTHPFHYEGQIFAQNGKIDDFNKHKPLLQSYILKSLVDKIQGETDTELLFFMFLSCKKYLEYRSRYLRNNTTRKKNTKIPFFTKSQIELYEKIINSDELRSRTSSNVSRDFPRIHSTPKGSPEYFTSHTTLKSIRANHSSRNSREESEATRIPDYEVRRNASSNADEIANNINAFAILVGIFREHSIELIANIIYANSKIVLVSRYIFYNKAKYTEKQMPPSLYLNKCKSNGNSGLLITSEPLFKCDSVLFPENTVTVLDYQKNKLDIHKIL
jgi:predicted glutamine amidotransferase